MDLKLKHLEGLITSLTTAKDNCDKFRELGFDIITSELFQSIENAVDVVLTLYFGENNAELIWDYVYQPETSQFKSINELYDYLKDSYSQLVRKDSALTLDQLRELFPQERMFEYFQEVINRHV